VREDDVERFDAEVSYRLVLGGVTGVHSTKEGEERKLKGRSAE
jgi:hypothetical protein